MQKGQRNESFALLFKKYRLRAGIESLTRFSDLLVQENIYYENSLYSRWQRGERTPKDRNVLLKMVRIFIKKGGISTIAEINRIFASVGQNDLTHEEVTHMKTLLANGGVSVNELVEYDTENHYSGLLLPLIHSIGLLNINSKLKSGFEFNFSGFIGVFTGFYFGLIIWWFTLWLYPVKNSVFHLMFSFAFGLIPLFGGGIGIISSRKWNSSKTSMGKSLLYFSLGLITWGIGEMIWSYYNFFVKVNVPYPSLADAAFILSWPLWAIGLYYLSLSTGFNFAIKKSNGKYQVVVIPIVSILASYYLLIVVGRDGNFITSSDPLKIFFDLAYPLLDTVLITYAILIINLSSSQTRFKYQIPLYIILAGIAINYFADFAFSYTTTNGYFYNGSYVDLLFTTAMYVLTVGVNNFEVS